MADEKETKDNNVVDTSNDKTVHEKVETSTIEKKPETTQADNKPPEQKFVKPEDQKDDIDFTAFENAIDAEKHDNIPVLPELDTKVKKEKTEKKEEVKTENKKVETKLTPEELKKQRDEEKAKRDYTGIDESLLPQVKQMGNEFFNAVAPVLKEHKKLKEEAALKDSEIIKLKENKLPEDYFQHPKGYVLTPEFEAGVTTLTRAQQIAAHWQDQLTKLKEGEYTYQEIDMDRETGELVVGKPIKADKSDIKLLENYVDGAKAQIHKVHSYVENVGKSHNERYRQALTTVADFEKKSFAQFEGENSEKFKPVVRDTITKALPPAFHNNPLATTLAKALLTIHALGQKLKGAGDEKKMEEEKKKEAEKIQPTKKEIESGEVKKGADTEITYDVFEKVIAGERES